MADIATLGLVVDSSQVTSASTALGGFSSAALAAESNALKLTRGIEVTHYEAMRASREIANMAGSLLGSGALTGALTQGAEALLGFVNPLGLIVSGAGLAVAGVLELRQGMDATSEALKRHTSLLDDLKHGYADAASAVSKYHDESARVLQLQTTADIAGQNKIAGSTAESLLGHVFAPYGKTGQMGILPEFSGFTDAITEFRKETLAGSEDFARLRQSITDMQAKNPALHDAAAKLLEWSAAGEKARQTAEGLHATLEKLTPLTPNERISGAFTNAGFAEQQAIADRVTRGFTAAGEAGINLPPGLQTALQARTPDAQAATADALFRSYQRGTADILANTRAIGLNAGAMTSQKVTMDLVNDAVSKGLILTPLLVDEINKEAEARTNATIAADKQKESYAKLVGEMDGLRDATKSYMDTISNDIINGKSKDIFGDLAKQLGGDLINSGENSFVDAVLGKHGQPGGALIGRTFTLKIGDRT